MLPDGIFGAFRRNRTERADEAAFLVASGDRSVAVSWRQFASDVESVAWIVRRYVPGAKIGLLGENSYEWFCVHAAIVFSGATVVPLEIGLSPEEIAERLAFVGAKALVHSAQ